MKAQRKNMKHYSIKERVMKEIEEKSRRMVKENHKKSDNHIRMTK